MKRSLIPSMIFSILILTACLSPRSGGASTPTMASAPSETPSPTATETPSPESLLPQEVKEKFELAGVDLADMQNAKYDKDGLHITLPGGEVIVLTNDQLQKGMYNGQDNVLQYRDEANQNVIYAFDKETGKWGVKVEQIDISNPEAFRTEEWEYLLSPAYLAELEQKEKTGLLPKVPDNPSYIKPGFVILNDESTNSEIMKHYAYETIFSLSNEIAYLNKDKRPYTLVDICKTSFMGIDMIFFVNEWKNSDGSSGFLAHFVPNYSLTQEVGLDVIVGRDENQYPTGGFFVKEGDLDGLKLYLDQWGIPGNDYSKFIKYYYSNAEIFLPTEIYQDWQSSGNLATKTKLPISPAGSNRITK